MSALKIAFVSSHPSLRRFRRDPSYIYRCENLGLALQRLGHRVSFVHLKALLLPRRFDVAVFLRPSDALLYRHVVARLRRQGTVLVGDCDDLLFDPACAAFRPSVINGSADRDETAAKFRRHHDALAALDRFIFSTEELSDRYRALHPDAAVTILPNAVHSGWRDIAPNPAPPRVLTYFSGTRTHDRDIALIAAPLQRVLDAQPDLSVQLVGPITPPFSHPRLLVRKKVAFSDYPYVLRDSYLNLAPLEDTPFNRSKSALKAIEPGFFEVPTIASPVGDFTRVAVDGVRYARDDAEWEAQIAAACAPERHAQLRRGLRQRILAHADIDRFAEAFVRFVAH